MNNFFRIRPLSNQEYNLSGKSLLKRDLEFLSEIRPGHGLIMAVWDESRKVGVSLSIGVVLNVDEISGVAEVEWMKRTIEFSPSPQGGVAQWSKPKGWFKFAKNVAARYRLREWFEKDFSVSSDGPSKGSCIGSGQSASATSGYVYLIKSKYGYKIGKAVNVKKRSQLFNVKLPFPIEVIHYAHFDNYTEAETRLHNMFSAKRLEGEWFDLTQKDVEYIKAQGIPMDASKL